MNERTQRIKFNHPAAPGESFAEDAFRSAIGQSFPVQRDGHPDVTGVLVAAAVADDGRNAELTIEVPLLLDTWMHVPFSIGVRE
jgi:hypothetical protein